MIKASFFAANTAPVTEDGSEKAPGQSLTFEGGSAKSFLGVATAFAEKHGLLLTDKGRTEYSPRFPHVESFGVQGSGQRMFVWAGA